MDDYRALVAAAAVRSNGEEIVPNRTPEHAAVVIAQLFDSGQQIIEILSTRLDDHVWGVDEVVNSALAFLRKEGTKLRVIVEEDVSTATCELLQRIADEQLTGRVRVFKISAETLTSYKFHFMVVDGKNHRWQKSRDKFEASIQFGNEQHGERLRLAFQYLKERSQEISLVPPKENAIPA